MRYWDSAAIVALLLEEPHTAECEAWLRSDPQIATWWLSRVECASALNRLEREEVLTTADLGSALRDLETLAASFVELQPTGILRTVGMRLLRVHPLRAADAMQLAAATVAAGDDRGSLEFVSYDARLLAAAEREGFVCLPHPTPAPPRSPG